MYELKVTTHFAAAHQLKMVAKKCENLHGHNWRIEICVRGEKLNDAGVLIDFGILKDHIADVIQRLDHCFLNESGFFPSNTPPSSENIAAYIAREVDAAIAEPGVRVSRVTAWESEDASATYIP
ncbi:MAG: 6-carboxytetrahydropterin synthase QueD [Desulfobacterales bacterium]